MLGRLLILFTVVPLLEVYLLVTLGGLMGPAATVGLVLVTGTLGAALARREGGRVWRDWQASIARGEMPEEGVLSSLLVLVGGVLLVTPGVLTDALGLALLIPPSRRAIAKVVKRRVEARMEVQTFEIHDPGAMPYFEPSLFQEREGGAGGEVIDVEARPSSTPGTDQR